MVDEKSLIKFNKDIEGLSIFLTKNPNYCCKGTKVSTITDVLDIKTRSPRFIIYPGEQFLCDIYANSFWVVELLQKKERDVDRGHPLMIRAICEILPDCRFMPKFSGYWMIPDDFIESRIPD